MLSHFRYSSKKKYFCRFFHNKHFCLGKGKGRDYGKMTGKEWQFLSNYYHLPNLNLYDLLKKLGKTIPVWLQKEIDLVLNNKRKRKRWWICFNHSTRLLLSQELIKLVKWNDQNDYIRPLRLYFTFLASFWTKYWIIIMKTSFYY